MNGQEAANHREIIDYFNSNGTPFETAPLEVGDFIVSGLTDALLVERKTISDFYSSVIDGRLFEQAKWLSANKEKNYTPIVVMELEGIANLIFDSKTKKRKYVETYVLKENEMRFYSAELGVAKFGVGLILTSGVLGTARFLKHQNDRLGEPRERRDYPERSGFKKDWSTEKMKEYLWDAFGHEFSKVFARSGEVKDLLESKMTHDELMKKIPIQYESGRTIPSIKREQLAKLLGFKREET